jgi:hypothetical protein
MAVSNKDLLKARMIAAQVVQRLGEKYWPVFDLLDREWNERKVRSSRINACLDDADPSDVRQDFIDEMP